MRRRALMRTWQSLADPKEFTPGLSQSSATRESQPSGAVTSCSRWWRHASIFPRHPASAPEWVSTGAGSAWAPAAMGGPAACPKGNLQNQSGQARTSDRLQHFHYAQISRSEGAGIDFLHHHSNIRSCG